MVRYPLIFPVLFAIGWKFLRIRIRDKFLRVLAKFQRRGVKIKWIMLYFLGWRQSW